jgi:hypothetical protein
MRSTYLVEQELLLDPRIRIGQINSFRLKLNLSIILIELIKVV